MTAQPPSPATRFTGSADPYGGGDPYADYRTADFPFAHLVDLADRRLGAGVVAVSDEFFAEGGNLLEPGPARFDPEAFGRRGKTMDGWETRRRRGGSAGRPHPGADDHDWALIRLGAPGVVRGVVVDTAHFRGNHPHSVSVEAACLPGTPPPERLLADDVEWTGIVPRTEVGGHAANGFAVAAERRFTHLRLRQYPDGGVARLRAHGEVAPDPAWLAALGTFDLVALENGGAVEDVSDRFYSSPLNTLRPGRSRRMDEGWENRRRRDAGHDWVLYRLAAQGEIRAVEIDTGGYRGNAPGWASLSVLDAAGGADPGDRTAPGWVEILPRTPLQPDAAHRFVLEDPHRAAVAATHVRLDVFPDGGVARLRVHGSLTGEGARRLAARHRELGG